MNCRSRLWTGLLLAATLAAPMTAFGEDFGFQRACLSPPARPTRTIAANPLTLAGILASARPGDRIELEGGRYGNIRLEGRGVGFRSLTAKPGQTPVLGAVIIRGGGWRLSGLVVDGEVARRTLGPPPRNGWSAHEWLINVADGSNVIIEDTTVGSTVGKYDWREEKLGVDDPTLWNGIGVANTGCVTLSRNHVTNVFNGIAVGGDQVGNNGRYIKIIDNKIDNFAGDGIDHYASASVISHNYIVNAHDVCAQQCVHSDGIQGWTYENKPGITNVDVEIDANTIIPRLDANLVLPNKAIQGITIFDGSWRNVKVTNNVIVAGVWQGLSIGGVDGLLIANNTVLASGDRLTWIYASPGTHEGGVTRNVVIRNNIATQIQLPKQNIENIRIDHNMEAPDARLTFVAFEPSKYRFDLHLKHGGGAVGRGSRESAPSLDIEGKPRAGSIDLGAYQDGRP